MNTNAHVLPINNKIFAKINKKEIALTLILTTV